MLPPSFEGRQRSLPQRVQRHPQAKEMRMPSNTQCHLKVEMQYKTGKQVVLHQDENSPTSEIAHVRSHWLFFSVASCCFFKGCHAWWITSRTKKRIIQDDYIMYKNDSKTTHNSATVTQGFSPPDSKTGLIADCAHAAAVPSWWQSKKACPGGIVKVGMKVSVA